MNIILTLKPIFLAIAAPEVGTVVESGNPDMLVSKLLAVIANLFRLILLLEPIASGKDTQ